MFDCAIFLSSEDDRYLVHGGIGTYIGVLTRWLKRFYPFMKVCWIAKSPTKQDFFQVDKYGVERFYLADQEPGRQMPFVRSYAALLHNQIARQTYFSHRAEEKIIFLLKKYNKKNILLEVGEWEGQANGLFRSYDSSKVLKVARLHTPLAICMQQNQLVQTSANYLQMLNEYQQIKHADLISSCTNYMRSSVCRYMLGKNHFLADKIVVLPNPVDTELFFNSNANRSKALKWLRELNPNSVFTGSFNVFIIGSVEKRKGAEYIIKSIAPIAKEIPQVRFCFFGHYAKNKTEISANTKLSPADLYSLLGHQWRRHLAFFDYLPHRRLPLVISAGDVFPIFSLGDNFPGTVAEIALAGKPIAALKRGGVKEMLSDKNGRFQAFSLGSDPSKGALRLLQAIKLFYKNPSLKINLGLKLRQLIQQKYCPEKVVPLIAETYWQALMAKQQKA